MFRKIKLKFIESCIKEICEREDRFGYIEDIHESNRIIYDYLIDLKYRVIYGVK